MVRVRAGRPPAGPGLRRRPPRTRPLRLIAPALGLAIGIAAMVAVVGISSSGQTALHAALVRLGTNLLTVTPGPDAAAALPATAEAAIGRIDGVTAVAAIGAVTARVSRGDEPAAAGPDPITVRAARTTLPAVLAATLAGGTWLDAGTARSSTAVLGSRAAERLGVHAAGPGTRVRINDRWFVVAGVLHPVALVPELDQAVLVGWEAAVTYLGFEGGPGAVYARSRHAQLRTVQAMLGAAANPADPGAVTVSRPSDALAAGRVTDPSTTVALLAMGAVGLLIGGVGAADAMDDTARPRRSAVDPHRHRGASHGRIWLRFVGGSLLMSASGGAGGVLLGAVGTAVVAGNRGWPTVVPAWVVLGGAGAALLIGAVAGLCPAVRAARPAPGGNVVRDRARAAA